MGWVGGSGRGLAGGAPGCVLEKGPEGGEAKEGGKRGGDVVFGVLEEE